MALTFDDGYKDIYDTAFQILLEYNIPATLFLTTDYIGSRRPLLDWQIFSLMSNTNGPREIQAGPINMCQKRWERREVFAFRVIEAAKSLNANERQNFLKTVNFYIGRLKIKFLNHGCLTLRNIREMSDAGIEFGSHGITHASIARLPIEEASREIRHSKQVISKQLGRECLHFSFPFGSALDYNDKLIAEVKSAGYETCLLNEHGYNHMEKDIFDFKRVIMDESMNINTILG